MSKLTIKDFKVSFKFTDKIIKILTPFSIYFWLAIFLLCSFILINIYIVSNMFLNIIYIIMCFIILFY